MKLTKGDFIALGIGVFDIILIVITRYLKKFYPHLFIDYKLFVLEKILFYIFYIVAIYIIVLRIRWAIYDSKSKGKIILNYKDDEVKYRETKAYRETMVRNEPKIKEAIKNKNFAALMTIANEYKKMGYLVEEAELFKKIIDLDPDGNYGKQAAKELINL